MHEPLLLSPEQAAQRLGVGRTTLYELIRSAELTSVKIGRRRLIATVDLEAYVVRLRDGGRTAA